MEFFKLIIDGEMQKIPVYYGELKPLSQADLFVLRHYVDELIKLNFKPLSTKENDNLLKSQKSYYHNSANEGVEPTNLRLALAQVMLFLRVPLNVKKEITAKYNEEVVLISRKAASDE